MAMRAEATARLVWPLCICAWARQHQIMDDESGRADDRNRRPKAFSGCFLEIRVLETSMTIGSFVGSEIAD